VRFSARGLQKHHQKPFWGKSMSETFYKKVELGKTRFLTFSFDFCMGIIFSQKRNSKISKKSQKQVGREQRVRRLFFFSSAPQLLQPPAAADHFLFSACWSLYPSPSLTAYSGHSSSITLR
jgi:hypothetical protein